MKKQILLIAVMIATVFSYNANAQVRVSLNIGAQPVWGPVGYDYVQYYYMPDVDAYYDVDRGVYIYLEGRNWVTRRSLPPRYRNYDLYHGYKVVVNEPSPWMHHDRYHTQYISYRGRHDQQIIRESRDERYYANPHHPHHNEWKQQHNNNARPTDRPTQVRPARQPEQRRDDRPQPQREGGRGHDNGKGDDKHGDKGQGHDDRGHGNGHR